MTFVRPFFDDLSSDFSAYICDLSFEGANSRLLGVVVDDGADGSFGEVHIHIVQPTILALPRQQVALRNM